MVGVFMCYSANKFLTANATREITNINLSLKLENFTISEKGTPAEIPQILTFLEKLNIQPKSHVTLTI